MPTIKQITKASRLHRHEWRDIKTLIDRCSDHDQFKIKIYWHIVQDRLTNEFNDFFYYMDGNLVAYLGLFTFGGNEAEMTAVVHPKYRRRGIFRKILAEAILELRQRYIPYCVWVLPQRSPLHTEITQNIGGQYLFSQIEMKAIRPPMVKTLPEIQLQLATSADLPLMAQLGSVSFKSSFAETLQRFTENMREKNRKAWLASIATHDNIGKIHIRYEDNNTAFIHDVCVLPEHRGKNIAMAMMLKTMDMLRTTGHKNIILDVELHNQGALKLYEQCGFETQQAYDFWRIDTDLMHQRWGR